MSLIRSIRTHLETNYGSAKERKERAGLDHSTQIRLRMNQKERIEEARASPAIIQKGHNSRKEFLLKNIINQRWVMSLQGLYL